MIETFLACDLFKGWKQEDIENLASIASSKQLNSGEIIFAEGADAFTLVLVKSGTIKIEMSSSNEDQAVAEFGTASYFGEMGMLSKDDSLKTRSASATASEPSVIVELPYMALDQFLIDNPALSAAFYKNIATSLSLRIRKTTKDLASVKALRLRHV